MNPTQQATAAPVDDAPRVESIGEIVVFVDGYTDPTDIMEFAGVLAQEYDAHLTGVFMRPAPAVTPPEMFVRGTGIPNVIEARQAEVERIEADHRARFDDIVRRNALGSEWRSVPYFSSDAGVHARYADLAVVARPDPAVQTAGPPGLVESLVLTSGRPVIVVPPHSTASRLSRILVGWNAGREATRAVADALPLLVRAAAVEVRRLSSDGEDVGRLLLSQAAAFGADLLVMGAYGHARLNELIFGGVTRTALRDAGLPVLMSR